MNWRTSWPSASRRRSRLAPTKPLPPVSRMSLANLQEAFVVQGVEVELGVGTHLRPLGVAQGLRGCAVGLGCWLADGAPRVDLGQRLAVPRGRGQRFRVVAAHLLAQVADRSAG